MLIFPRAAYVQSASPLTKDFQLPRNVRGMRFNLIYAAETNAASTLDVKFQYHVNDTTWSDLLTGAEVAVKFPQFTGVANGQLTCYPTGETQELTTLPSLFALVSLPRQIRAVAAMAGGGGTDTITFSLVGEELY